MKLRVIDGNIVAERVVGLEGDLDCITQKVERIDATVDAIDCVIDYLIDKEIFKDKKRIVVTNNNKNASLCLIDNDEYRLIKTDTLNDYQKRIEELEETQQYDYIFMDCPPSLGLVTLNAFAAADSVLVPIQSEYYALEGLGQLMSTIDLVQKHLNPKL